MTKKNQRLAFLVASALLSGLSFAQQMISDTLTGTASTYPWIPIGGACLTAGTNPTYNATTNTIPGCAGSPHYTQANPANSNVTPKLTGGVNGSFPDPSGQGALRLTTGDITVNGNNGTNDTGAVVSDFNFPTNQGVQVTFTTVTYGGNAFGATGADGMSFFLVDDGLWTPASPKTSSKVGALGGSLGYSCSNGNSVYDGIVGGYIGVGIDEYGNFANGSYITTGGKVTSNGNGDNTSSGAGAKPGRISLRGSGNVNWETLSSNYSVYYPSSLRDADKETAVKSTCKAGYLIDYSAKKHDSNGNLTGSPTSKAVTYNYNYLAGDDLSVDIAGPEAGSKTPQYRANATPITYALRITQDGNLSFSYSVNGGNATQVINKNITASNGGVPKYVRFGFSASTGSGSNIHEITCFKAAPIGQSSSSAGTNVPQLGRVTAGTQLYFAYYHANM